MELLEHSRVRPIALVLPALYSEFEGKAMPGIISELSEIEYLGQIVLVLGRASDKDFGKAREFMASIPYEVKIIRNEGKRIREIYDTITRNGLDPGQDGKGRSCWLAYGYVLAVAKADVIALHDCDIVTG
ncbi:MAG TPA: hypothetical protein VLG39_06935 [Nitrospirota bacterium]|nr:hypothetical protein [Nitrospirota bacterium]